MADDGQGSDAVPSPATGASLDEAKAACRLEAFSARDRIPDRAIRSAAAAQNLTTWLGQSRRGAVLAGYWPIRGEVDPRPVLAAHAGPGCLPVVVGMGQPLIFRAWRLGQPVQPGPFGTFHPDAEAAEMQPEVVIVPLAAFDRSGARLGYGGGFYDRSLQALRHGAGAGRVLAVGLAFAGQEMAGLPFGSFDQRLDLIVTEEGIILPDSRNDCDVASLQ